MKIIFGLVLINLKFAFAKADIKNNESNVDFYTYPFLLDNVSSILRENLNQQLSTPGNFF